MFKSIVIGQKAVIQGKTYEKAKDLLGRNIEVMDKEIEFKATK